ncbi:MAG TPA: LysM peptidoglycan-binding domain-containing protein [Reyranella sp.]|nr:LysM peptidoglycan-binding domain-containing protein [Reyranella sp.]
MSRTVLTLVAVGAAVIAIALGIAWQRKLLDQAVIDHAAKPVAQPAAPTAPPAAPEAAKPEPPKPANPPAAAVMAPSFDVARIDQSGRAVIAGRAAPGSKIVLLDGGKEIAHGEADARGEWVLLAQEPPLSPGTHELRVVQHVEGHAPVTSEQVVVANVPQPPASGGTSSDQTLVVIAPSSGAATLVQPPSKEGVPKSNDLSLSTLDYDEHGHVTVSGLASAGAAVRAYVDDKLAGEGSSGADGHWRISPADPVEVGKHKLRLDRLGKDGKPTARLEVPFERLPSLDVSGDNRRLHVVKGDNLWNIARAHYGEGLQYTVIYNANKNQIRDPDLIYPGQVFSLPKVN